ncbi:MAG: polyphosphate:AMP phosphotransferase [bacterium]|nr:polyphosphate:AMP phosphotransferase [bacterium]
MFEAAEAGHRISLEEYKVREPALRQALLEAQYKLLETGNFPVLIIVGGADGAGKGATVNLLNEWMDPRHIVTHAFDEPREEEAERPPMWRFWLALPPKRHIGVMFNAWYHDILQRDDQKPRHDPAPSLDEIRNIEQMLAADGTLLLKFWFHLSRSAQKERIKELESDPKTRWRVTDTDRQHLRHYKRLRKTYEYVLHETSTSIAPWSVIDGSDRYYRSLTAGTLLLDAINKRLAQKRPKAAPPSAQPVPTLDSRNILNTIDYTQALNKKHYQIQLEKYQGRLNLLTRHPRFARKSLIILLEGPDAAGKGGSIRRITAALDARQYRVIPVAAPTDEERTKPYLWRFWRHLPLKNHITIFDRSWYGRVLVERVEKMCSDVVCIRSFHEINDFEAQLIRNDVIVVKFWLAITKDVQLKRFRSREETPYKQYKLTEDDWRNRRKWASYEKAVCDMVTYTSTAISPWHLVPSNDVEFARIRILKTICESVEAALAD